jgi:hypothetical protein
MTEMNDRELISAVLKSLEQIHSKLDGMDLRLANVEGSLKALGEKVDFNTDELKSDFRQVRRKTFALETDLDETINRVNRIEPKQ